jgi:hypothetical protein
MEKDDSVYLPDMCTGVNIILETIKYATKYMHSYNVKSFKIFTMLYGTGVSISKLSLA